MSFKLIVALLISSKLSYLLIDLKVNLFEADKSYAEMTWYEGCSNTIH